MDGREGKRDKWMKERTGKQNGGKKEGNENGVRRKVCRKERIYKQ
jgi:hypothetical protein